MTNNDGGNAVTDDWTLTATRSSGSGDASRDFSNLGGSGVFETVFANAGYNLAESTVGGYTAGSWSCDGGSLLGSTITLTINDAVTCTITNDDIQVIVAGPVNHPPSAVIISPAFFETFLTTDSITFSGLGDDAEDGIIAGGSMVWTSNIDGQIGLGTSFARSLSAGTHTITLIVTDSDGATGDAIRIITVNSPADTGGGGNGGGGEGPGPTATPTPAPTSTPTPESTAPDGGASGGTATGGVVAPPTPAPTPTPVVAEPTATPVPTPTATPMAEPTATPVAEPAATPVPAQPPASPGPGATALPPSTPTAGDGGGGSALPAGAIAGIILAVIVAMAAAIYYDVRRRRGQFI